MTSESDDSEAERTAFFFLSDKPNDSIGGCVHGLFTLHQLYQCIDILVVPERPVEGSEPSTEGRVVKIRMRGDRRILEDSADIMMSPGDYIISPKYNFIALRVNQEPFLDRISSRTVTPRDALFRNRVRQRDGGCVITGVTNSRARLNKWSGYEAAHIWPLSKGTEWIRGNSGRWITDSDSLSEAQKMNSPQNGILLLSTPHVLFDSYQLAVNPKDDYTIYVFGDNDLGYRGKKMSVRARENGEIGARDALLSWHFSQCVFANMRGAGEPTWDYGPREEGDVVGRLLSEDHGMARLGDEVAARLALTPHLPLSQDGPLET